MTQEKTSYLPTESRYNHLNTLFDCRTRDRILGCSILVIGAGGIGCELLKNLVCTGFAQITVIDLDNVDTSNLNRQFLFQKKHVKRPKALVARETASAFNPNVTIHAFQDDITLPHYDQAYFKSFDLVLNALDNLAARRHVNKMCIMTKVPLIESGTAGYIGQVQPIRPGETECYDCHPKPLPKTFPVCTIRSTPSTSIHCIVWAKSYLFPQLFGPEDENEGAGLDEAVKNGESAQEIENLRAEVKKMKEIRARLDSPDMTKIVFTKVFEEDINRLLMMEDMWKHRTAPTPLNYDEITSSSKKNQNIKNDEINNNSTSNGTGLKDQQSLSLKDSFELFCSSLVALGKRIQSDPTHEPLRWDKDDDDALDFVTAAANLRASIFGIPQKTRFEVKEMAGNIIPAIATTNSAVAALMVFQAISILSRLNSSDKNSTECDMITACRPWYNRSAERIIVAGNIEPPNPHCEVCQAVYSTVRIRSDCTLKEFINYTLKGKLYKDDDESITIQEGHRLLFDPDFTDNKLKSFKELNLFDPSSDRILRITDEDEKFVPIYFTISKNPPEENQRILIEGLPDSIPLKPKSKVLIDTTQENNNLSDIEEVIIIRNNQILNSNSSNLQKEKLEIILINDDNINNNIVVIEDEDQKDSSSRPCKKIKLDHHSGELDSSNHLVHVLD